MDITLRGHHVTSHHVQLTFGFGHILAKFADFVMDPFQQLEHQFVRGFRHCASATTSGYSNTIVLNHRVRQKLVAHGLQVGFGLGLVGSGELDVEHLALAHLADAVEAQPRERVLDRLALRVEDAVLEGDGDTGFHRYSWADRRLAKGLPLSGRPISI
ncbi:hypothetical protein MPL3356_240040 [Mesorhizobium plurifarium]|uniref:Uncharacterized protein n=1 Tax=Mesorhizobium plurifarium TaxID=69974 RepID=A0A090DMD4_MESPL|nr:hypothetical protein MPL3356_240040 [Mesorhizobium plurifarium]CDX49759.1 hypothetical protein MPL3365_100208 [Mesorhizobium plurifarium]